MRKPNENTQQGKGAGSSSTQKRVFGIGGPASDSDLSKALGFRARVVLLRLHSLHRLALAEHDDHRHPKVRASLTAAVLIRDLESRLDQGSIEKRRKRGRPPVATRAAIEAVLVNGGYTRREVVGLFDDPRSPLEWAQGMQRLKQRRTKHRRAKAKVDLPALRTR